MNHDLATERNSSLIASHAPQWLLQSGKEKITWYTKLNLFNVTPKSLPSSIMRASIFCKMLYLYDIVIFHLNRNQQDQSIIASIERLSSDLGWNFYIQRTFSWHHVAKLNRLPMLYSIYIVIIYILYNQKLNKERIRTKKKKSAYPPKKWKRKNKNKIHWFVFSFGLKTMM